MDMVSSDASCTSTVLTRLGKEILVFESEANSVSVLMNKGFDDWLKLRPPKTAVALETDCRTVILVNPRERRIKEMADNMARVTLCALGEK